MTKTKKGTSLVELLAVIVIMGIIAAIAVPTVGALLKNTRIKAAGSDVQTLVSSIDTYRTSEGKSGSATYTWSSKGTCTDSALSAYLTDDEGKNTVAPNFSGTIVYAADGSVTVTGTLEKDGKVYTFESAKADTNFKPAKEENK